MGAKKSSVVTADVVVAAFRAWLGGERGLSVGTVNCYGRQARTFLRWLPRPLDTALRELDSGQVTSFMVDFCRGRNMWTAKSMVTAVRALLRFLHVSGRVEVSLAPAAPAVAGWRLASLPRGLDAKTVARSIDGCARDNAMGRRDYAMLVMLARLGMRSSEVAALELGDIDWRAGEITVHGKGSRVDRLPLPVEVGEAVVEYLRDGRRDSDTRAVFCSTRPPFHRLAPNTISTIVGRTCDQAGIPRVYAHRLRHTLATEMLRAGASLPEIGQVLRHRSLASTSIYAKVDSEALRVSARPWPSGDRS